MASKPENTRAWKLSTRKKTCSRSGAKVASRISYDPRRLQGVTLYRETERAFSKGERVQFTAPNRERHIANRELGTIERIEKNGNLQLRMDSGRRVTFNLKENRLTPLEKASKTVLKSRSCKPPIF
jgi:hypothetical protein